MAALALVVGTSIAVGRAMPALVTSQASDSAKPREGERPKAGSERPRLKPTVTVVPSVQLNLVIAGLSPKGCEVQIKPGNASCKFNPIYEKRGDTRQVVASDGRTGVELRDVELRGADRTITVAITVRESGQAAKTFYRGFRLTAKPEVKPRGATASAPVFTCYLSSPSKLATAAGESRSRR
jgi:hypothetical protein